MALYCCYIQYYPSEAFMGHQFRQNYRPDPQRVPPWLMRLWRWL